MYKLLIKFIAMALGRSNQAAEDALHRRGADCLAARIMALGDRS
ncbi:hypothetical protein [Spirulina major]|nr:hypothetical protein [Spirulina major]